MNGNAWVIALPSKRSFTISASISGWTAKAAGGEVALRLDLVLQGQGAADLPFKKLVTCRNFWVSEMRSCLRPAFETALPRSVYMPPPPPMGPRRKSLSSSL
jgi:hypothetical protein